MQKEFRPSPAFYWAIFFIIGSSILISAVLIWIGHTRIQDFESSHRNIAASTIRLVSRDIQSVLDDNKRLVSIFAQSYSAQLIELAKKPDNESLRDTIFNELKRWFPSMFAFTISDESGNSLLDDFDGTIGTICKEDMRSLAITNQYTIRVHPHPSVYHYDIMAKWGVEHFGGIFFVSFEPEDIARRLIAASPPGHELVLIIKDRSHLIEITETGSRDKTPREDYRMPESDKKRILDMIEIPGTEWHLADLHQPQLFSTFRENIILIYGAIISAFILGAIIASSMIICFERQRISASKMRDEMLSLFSHDLRSPLVSIVGAVALLKNTIDKSPPSNSKELLELTLDNAMSMSRIVNDILDIHKLESGNMDFHFTETDLNEVCQKACDLNKSYAEQFDVQIEQKLSEEAIHLNADEKRLIQALTNLLTNAIKYSPENGVVTLSCYREHGKPVIAIEDHGIGIPAQYHDQLFEKFTQIKQKTRKKVASTGLGLSIVRHIVEAHQGHVSFKSEEGKGSIFYIEFESN